jgi:hypothetical protein
MKICKKDNCDDIAIPRGKYCEKHKTGKKNIRNNTHSNSIHIDNYTTSIINSIPQHSSNLFNIENNYNFEQKEKKRIENEENRKIIQEQEIEYKKTLIMDEERIRLKEEEIELQKILKISELSFNEEKRKKIIDEPEDNYFLIQFNIPNGKKIKRKFSKLSYLKDIKNYLDIYFIDNNLEIKNYDFCYYSSANCKQLITEESDGQILENIFNSKSFALFIINNDA